MNHAELLKAAMPLLWDGVSPIGGTTPYTCYAIAAASCIDFGSVSIDALDMRYEIVRRLEGGTLYSWLLDRVPLHLLTDERVQAHRLAWMRLLPEEAEQNGGWLLNTGHESGKRSAA